MVVIDISTFEKPKPIKDSPEAYETRCIVFDAERAAKMDEDPMRACSWPHGSKQYDLWMTVYSDVVLCKWMAS